MFKPKPMSKISVFGSKKDMGMVIETLHNLKVYHIEEHKPDKIDIGECMPDMEDMASALVRAKSILSSWKVSLEEVETDLW